MDDFDDLLRAFERGMACIDDLLRAADAADEKRFPRIDPSELKLYCGYPAWTVEEAVALSSTRHIFGGGRRRPASRAGTPNPSSGPKTQMRSSRPLNAGTKR